MERCLCIKVLAGIKDVEIQKLDKSGFEMFEIKAIHKCSIFKTPFKKHENLFSFRVVKKLRPNVAKLNCFPSSLYIDRVPYFSYFTRNLISTILRN